MAGSFPLPREQFEGVFLSREAGGIPGFGAYGF